MVTMPSLLLTGDTLFQMAEVHRQIQVQLEDVVRQLITCSFHYIHYTKQSQRLVD